MDCTVERDAFVEGVMFAVENMTSGNNELKSMNLPLRIRCLTADGTGGSNSDTDGSICPPAANGMSEAMDNAFSLVSCGRSGGACAIVEVKLVGRVVAEPCCATENTGGELAGDIGVELMEGCGGREVGVDVCCVIRKRGLAVMFVIKVVAKWTTELN